MDAENRHIPEDIEIEPKVNFTEIFSNKLESIAPLQEYEKEPYKSEVFRSIGIDEVTKKGLGLIFLTSLQPFELWLEDYKDIKDEDNQHNEAEQNLRQFLESNGVEFGARMSAIILQDNKGKVYLFVDQNIGEIIQGDVAATSKVKMKMWTDLAERYQLEKIIGSFGHIGEEERIESLLDLDLVGKQRQDNYLASFAEKYKMTNSQFIRFEMLVKSAQEAKQSTDVDKIAQEVLAQD